MKKFEMPRIRISMFSRKVVTDLSTRSAWERAMADAGSIGGTKGTVSVKLNKAGN